MTRLCSERAPPQPIEKARPAARARYSAVTIGAANATEPDVPVPLAASEPWSRGRVVESAFCV
jgi:hypothetical protein